MSREIAEAVAKLADTRCLYESGQVSFDGAMEMTREVRDSMRKIAEAKPDAQGGDARPECAPAEECPHIDEDGNCEWGGIDSGLNVACRYRTVPQGNQPNHLQAKCRLRALAAATADMERQRDQALAVLAQRNAEDARLRAGRSKYERERDDAVKRAEAAEQAEPARGVAVKGWPETAIAPNRWLRAVAGWESMPKEAKPLLDLIACALEAPPAAGGLSVPGWYGDESPADMMRALLLKAYPGSTAHGRYDLIVSALEAPPARALRGEPETEEAD